MADDPNEEIDAALEVAHRSEIYIVARSIAIGLLLAALAIIYDPITAVVIAVVITAMTMLPGKLRARPAKVRTEEHVDHLHRIYSLNRARHD